MRMIVPLLALLGSAWPAPAAGAGDGATHAQAVTVVEPPFSDPRILVAKSMPPQFDLMLEREMPTPGWSFVVDALEVNEEGGRIVARVTEVGPTGNVAQVITKTTCRLGLGRLRPGSYVLELWTRRAPADEHRPAQALVLVAR